MSIVSMRATTGWQARTCYAAAALFTLASGGTNLIYGWSKGTDPASSLVWAGVAGAVAVVFALSWPALIRSLDAKQWSAAVIAFVALVLSGAYSMTAALGSAAGGRTNAATAETSVTDARKKLQAAYDRADAELQKLPAARPVAEIEALLLGAQWWRPPKGCTTDKVAQRVMCPTMEAELARSRQREKLKGEMAHAETELSKTQPAKVANSDAKALARYMAAIGVDIGPERLNDLLVLLAVFMIEAGGGLSLAIGMALGQQRTGHGAGTRSEAQETQGAPFDVPLRRQLPDYHALSGVTSRPVETVEAAFLRILRQRGGEITTGQRTLARTLGVSATHINRVLAKLAGSGAITLDATRRGSVVRLAAQ